MHAQARLYTLPVRDLRERQDRHDRTRRDPAMAVIEHVYEDSAVLAEAVASSSATSWRSSVGSSSTW